VFELMQAQMTSHSAMCVYWNHWQCVYCTQVVLVQSCTPKGVNNAALDAAAGVSTAFASISVMLSCVDIDSLCDSHLMTTALIDEKIQPSVLVCDLTLTGVVCRGRADTYPCWHTLPSPPLLRRYTCQHYTPSVGPCPFSCFECMSLAELRVTYIYPALQLNLFSCEHVSRVHPQCKYVAIPYIFGTTGRSMTQQLQRSAVGGNLSRPPVLPNCFEGSMTHIHDRPFPASRATAAAPTCYTCNYVA
jgi:hypothetical protein